MITSKLSTATILIIAVTLFFAKTCVGFSPQTSQPRNRIGKIKGAEGEDIGEEAARVKELEEKLAKAQKAIKDLEEGKGKEKEKTVGNLATGVASTTFDILTFFGKAVVETTKELANQPPPSKLKKPAPTIDLSQAEAAEELKIDAEPLDVVSGEVKPTASLEEAVKLPTAYLEEVVKLPGVSFEAEPTQVQAVAEPIIDAVEEAKVQAVPEPVVDAVEEAEVQAVAEPVIDAVEEAEVQVVAEPVIDAVEEAEEQAVAENDEETAPELEPRQAGPWTEYFDPDSGDMFYYNSETEVSQWEKPEEFLEEQLNIEIEKPGGGLGLVFGMNDAGNIVVDVIRSQASVIIKKRFQVGDKIVSVNGVSYDTDVALASAIREKAVDTTLVFQVERIPQTQSEESLAEPSSVAELENETVIEESVIEESAPQTDPEPEIEPFGLMKFRITKSNEKMGISFKSVNGIITVDYIGLNAVESVTKNFQLGDIVLAMNELRYPTDVDLATAIREMEVGETMIFDIFRVPQVNIGIQKSYDELGIAFQRIDGKITVAEISENAPWEVLDQFKIGDKVVTVNGVSYTTNERMAKAIKEMEVGEIIDFLVQREDPEDEIAPQLMAFPEAQIELPSEEDEVVESRPTILRNIGFPQEETTGAPVDYENTITTSSGKASSVLNVEIPKTDEALGLAFIMASGNIEVAKIQDEAPLEVKNQLQVGDEILSMNGVTYATDDDMAAAIRGLGVGALINFKVQRLLKVPQGFTSINIRVEKPSESLGLAFKMFQGSMILASFEEGVPSEMVAQLKVGDKIVSVNGVSFSSADEMIAAIKQMDVGATITFEVQRSATVYQGNVPLVPKEVVAAAALKDAEEREKRAAERAAAAKERRSQRLNEKSQFINIAKSLPDDEGISVVQSFLGGAGESKEIRARDSTEKDLVAPVLDIPEETELLNEVLLKQNIQKETVEEEIDELDAEPEAEMLSFEPVGEADLEGTSVVEILKSGASLGLNLNMKEGVIAVDYIGETALPALKAGLEIGDQIVAVNNRAYPSDVDMASAIRSIAVGQKIVFAVKRVSKPEEEVAEEVESVQQDPVSEVEEETSTSVTDSAVETVLDLNLDSEDIQFVEIVKPSKSLGLSFIMENEAITVDYIGENALPDLKAALEIGDQIVAVNNLAYATDADLAGAIRALNVGETVVFAVKRVSKSSEMKNAEVESAESNAVLDTEVEMSSSKEQASVPEAENEISSIIVDLDFEAEGLKLVDFVKSDLALNLRFTMDNGAITIESIGEKAILKLKENLNVGDQIVAVNNVAYRTDIDMASAIRSVRLGETITFAVKPPYVRELGPAPGTPIRPKYFARRMVSSSQSKPIQSVEEPIQQTVEENEPENKPISAPKFLVRPSFFARRTTSFILPKVASAEETKVQPIVASTEETKVQPKVPSTAETKTLVPMKFRITKSSDLLGISFKSANGVTAVDYIRDNAVESVAKNFEVGDVIVAMNELSYPSDVELATAIREMEVGETTIFEISRLPKVNIGIQKSFESLGIAFQKIDGKITVADISEDAPWEVLDQFKIGDQVFSVNGISYDTNEEMANAIKEMEVGDTIDFLIRQADPEVKSATESFVSAEAQIKEEDGDESEPQDPITTSSGEAYSVLNVEVSKPDRALGLAFTMASGNIEVAKIQDEAPVEVLDQLQVGDEILSMNGVAYATDDDLATAIRGLGVGTLINFEVRRILKVPQGFTSMNIQVKKPSESLGLAFKMFQGSIRLASFEEGVQPEMVEQLKVGDKIVSVNGISFRSVDKMVAAIRDMEVGATISFNVQRSTTVYQGTVPLVPKEVVAAIVEEEEKETAPKEPVPQVEETEILNEVLLKEVLAKEVELKKNDEPIQSVEEPLQQAVEETAPVSKPVFAPKFPVRPNFVASRIVSPVQPKTSDTTPIVINKSKGRLGLIFRMENGAITIDSIEDMAMEEVKERFKVGDQVVMMNNKGFLNDEDLAAALRAVDVGENILFSVKRSPEMFQEELGATELDLGKVQESIEPTVDSAEETTVEVQSKGFEEQVEPALEEASGGTLQAAYDDLLKDLLYGSVDEIYMSTDVANVETEPVAEAPAPDLQVELPTSEPVAEIPASESEVKVEVERAEQRSAFDSLLKKSVKEISVSATEEDAKTEPIFEIPAFEAEPEAELPSFDLQVQLPTSELQVETAEQGGAAFDSLLQGSVGEISIPAIKDTESEYLVESSAVNTEPVDETPLSQLQVKLPTSESAQTPASELQVQLPEVAQVETAGDQGAAFDTIPATEDTESEYLVESSAVNTEPVDENPLSQLQVKLPTSELAQTPASELQVKLPEVAQTEESSAVNTEPVAETPVPEFQVKLPTSELQVKLPTSEPEVKLPTSEPQVKLPTSEPKEEAETEESSAANTEPVAETPVPEFQVKLPTSEPQVKPPTSELQVKLPTSEPEVKLPTSEPQVKLPTSEPKEEPEGDAKKKPSWRERIPLLRPPVFRGDDDTDN